MPQQQQQMPYGYGQPQQQPQVYIYDWLIIFDIEDKYVQQSLT
jgi:hypothetical protein